MSLTDPFTFGRAAARATLRSIPGGAQPTLLRDRTHVTNLRAQHAQAVAAGHPSVYDRTDEPDRPVFPADVADALRTVLAAVARPGSPRPVEAAAVLAMWAQLDDAPVHGYPRPRLS